MGSLAGDDTEQLGNGFWRSLVIRKSGNTSGRVDIYVFTPDGVKLRSRPELNNYLRNSKIKYNVDVEAFFQKPSEEDQDKSSKANIIPQGSDSFKVLNTRNMTKKQRDLMAKQVGMGEAVVSLDVCSASQSSASESPEPENLRGKSKTALPKKAKPNVPVPEAPPEDLGEAKKVEVNTDLEQTAKTDLVQQKKEPNDAKRKNLRFEDEMSKQQPETAKPKPEGKKVDKNLNQKLEEVSKVFMEKAKSSKKDMKKPNKKEATVKRPFFCSSPDDIKMEGEQMEKKLKIKHNASENLLFENAAQKRAAALPKIRRLSDAEKAKKSENTIEYKSPLQLEDNKEAPAHIAKSKGVAVKEQKPATIKVLKNIPSSVQKNDLIAKPVSSTAVEVPIVPTVHFLDITVPNADISPYHLVYEDLKGEPWKVLLASVLMKSVNSVSCRSMVLDFFIRFPNLESIQREKLLEFFVDVESVPMVRKLARETEEVARSLQDRVARLEDVPHSSKYSFEVYRIFCLQQFNEKDKEIPSYDLKSYVRWRLARK